MPRTERGTPMATGPDQPNPGTGAPDSQAMPRPTPITMSSGAIEIAPRDDAPLAALLRAIVARGGIPAMEGLTAEDRDPRLCPRCQGRGFIYAPVLPDAPDYGRAVDCPHRVAELEAALPARLTRLWERTSGVPQDMQHLRLETHPNLTSANRGLLDALTHADYEHDSWYLFGNNSLGKTGAAVGYAWAFLWAVKAPVWFVTTTDLLDAIKRTYGRQYEPPPDPEMAVAGPLDPLERARTIPLLVLDDLGAEYLKDPATGPESWTAERLYTLINHR